MSLSNGEVFIYQNGHSEGVNNFVSLDFLLGRFLPTVINRKPSIYNGSWAPPTPGLWNKVEGQRHKIKNTTVISFPIRIFSLMFFLLAQKRRRIYITLFPAPLS